MGIMCGLYRKLVMQRGHAFSRRDVWLMAGEYLVCSVFCIPVTTAEELDLGSPPAALVLDPRRASLTPTWVTQCPETGNVLASSGTPGK